MTEHTIDAHASPPRSLLSKIQRLSKLSALGLAVALLCILVGAAAFGQGENPSSSTAQQPRMPLPDLYWRFLISQNRFDREATALEQHGHNASYLRSFYQQRLGFSDSEFAKVREAAGRFLL